MQNLFVKENDEFTLKFTVATGEKGEILSDTTKESLIESFGDKIKNSEIKEYTVICKKPSFGDSSKLYEEIFNPKSEYGSELNPVFVRFVKIKMLVKKWDLKGELEKPTEEDIKQLHPTIAMVISIQIDAETGGIFS